MMPWAARGLCWSAWGLPRALARNRRTPLACSLHLTCPPLTCRGNAFHGAPQPACLGEEVS